MLIIMEACFIFGFGSVAIVFFIILPDGLSVAGGTAAGSGVLFIGTGAQALNEMVRFRTLRKLMYPEGFMRTLRWSMLSSYTFFRTTREKYRQRYLEAMRSGSAMRRKLQPDEQEKLLSDMWEAMTKARNWIIILGGSAILFAASIRACVGG